MTRSKRPDCRISLHLSAKQKKKANPCLVQCGFHYLHFHPHLLLSNPCLVQLTDEPDSIAWRWTADGTYTARSAYNAQFIGAYSLFSGDSIWKAEIEGKHKIFAWLLVQSKILTTDKLLARQWPCNPICSLCNQEQETASHLILHCKFAQQVWSSMASWTQNLVHTPQPGLQILDWWERELAKLPKKIRKLKAAMMIYTSWNIWKERNRRVFNQQIGSPVMVLQEIKREINDRKLACGGPELSFVSNV